MPDIQEAATRKLGPLPAWGWGVAVAGAVIVFRIMRGGKSSSTPSPTATVVGGSGVAGSSDASGGSSTDPFSGANSLVEQLLGQVNAEQGTIQTQGSLITDLQNSVKSLTDYQALQTKLSGLLKARGDALFNLNAWRTNLNTYQDALAKCRTAACRKTQNANIANANSKIAAYTKQASDYQTQITATQNDINKLGATS